MGRTRIVVVETPEFLARTKKLLSEAQRTALIDRLSADPAAGELIEGTGGVRKLRLALEGRGKRGGARVIYFHHDAGMPLFLLTAYAKNDKSDLTAAERNAMRRLTDILVRCYRGARDDQDR
ncbi:MAG TPA: type II toxin-antitoxin system RelE/ParE family toxin [Alphaproteobacteria bacterium]|nr:type II toxin-antitoxin system RelE/ParE family toxin [Alphaproteobacteria bacterium]